MTIRVKTEIQKQGLAENADQSGLMEYGYGLYVNAFVYDSDFAHLPTDAGCMGMYATERVSFDASAERISKARRVARQRARRRYAAELRKITGEV